VIAVTRRTAGDPYPGNYFESASKGAGVRRSLTIPLLAGCFWGGALSGAAHGAEQEIAPPQDRELCALSGDYGCWFSIQIAPEVISDGPFASESPTTDSTSVKWTFTALQPLSEEHRLDFKLTAGPRVTVDSDRDADASSALGFAFEIQRQRSAGGLQPFVSFGLEFVYPDFFREGNYTNHAFQAGLRFRRKLEPVTFNLAISPTIVQSTRALSDYFGVPVSASVSFPLIRDNVGILIDAAIERRWYGEADPQFGRPQRQWRSAVYGGLDLASWFNCMIVRPGERPASVFSEFAVGVRWVEVQSNHPGRDQSSFRVIPAASIKIPIGRSAPAAGVATARVCR
jgi:hypothetical protein